MYKCEILLILIAFIPTRIAKQNPFLTFGKVTDIWNVTNTQYMRQSRLKNIKYQVNAESIIGRFADRSH